MFKDTASFEAATLESAWFASATFEGDARFTGTSFGQTAFRAVGMREAGAAVLSGFRPGARRRVAPGQAARSVRRTYRRPARSAW
ncbi:pentapeptide repeat-containing protein [Streptomyces flavidovirens]|uniref:pentapeptide repeat-containing protein n=1 Tax=Streptomyces flavidovirens TaxID=67298 RepID=UPI00369D2686